jgi:hypothetical protein
MTPEETLRQALLEDKFPESDAKPIVPIADPLKYNRMTAASAWMGNLTGRDISPEDIGWQAEKDALAQEFFKMPEARDVSDETVHDLIRSHIQTSDNATNIALNSALSGRPFSETLNEIQALTGVSKTRGIRDRYVNEASGLYSNIASKRAQYSEVIDKVAGSLGEMLKKTDTDVGMTDVFNDATERLIGVPAEDRRLVIEAIAATGNITAKERSSYLSKFEWRVNRMAETLGAASVSNLSTALESVFDLAAFGSGLADPRDVASAAPEGNKSRELSLLAQQIRSAAYEKLDPIKSNSWIGKQGLAVADMGMQSSVALVNPLAAFAVNLAYFRDTMGADAMTQNPGMTVEQADQITVIGAPVNAAIETITALIPFGKVKLPFIQKWLMAETASVSGALRNFGIRAATGTATEIGEEIAQAYVPLKIQELRRAMGQDMPAVDWERNMPNFADIAEEVWAPALLFSIIGAGSVSINDINNGRSLAADLDLLIAKGIAPENAAKIKEASDLGDYNKVDSLFREEFDSDVKASKPDIQAATDRLKARFRDQSSMDVLQDTTSPEYTAKVIRTTTGWQVQTGDGNVITTETKEAADQIYNNIRQVGNQKEAEVMAEILDGFYAGGMGRGAQVEMTGETTMAQEIKAGEGRVFAERRDASGGLISQRDFGPQALETVRAEAEAAGIQTDTRGIFARINGSNEVFPQQVGDTTKGIWRILSLFESRKNAQPQVATLLHEDIESKFTLGLINKSWTIGDIQKAFAGLLPAFANITAPATLTDEQIAKMSNKDQEAYYAKQSEFNWISNVRKIVAGDYDAAMLRETFSEMYVRDRFALDRKGRATGLPAGLISRGIEAAVMGAKTQEEAGVYKRFRAMFKAFSAHFKAVFKTVQTMVAARKEGKIGEDWDSFVNKVLGIDEVKQMEGQVVDEVKAMLGVNASKQTFSISQPQFVTYTEENMPPPEKMEAIQGLLGLRANVKISDEQKALAEKQIAILLDEPAGNYTFVRSGVSKVFLDKRTGEYVKLTSTTPERADVINKQLELLQESGLRFAELPVINTIFDSNGTIDIYRQKPVGIEGASIKRSGNDINLFATLQEQNPLSSEKNANPVLRVETDSGLKNMGLVLGEDGMVRSYAFDFDGIPEDSSSQDIEDARAILEATPDMEGVPLSEFSQEAQQQIREASILEENGQKVEGPTFSISPAFSEPYKDRSGEDAGSPLTDTEIREGIEDEQGTQVESPIEIAELDKVLDDPSLPDIPWGDTMSSFSVSPVLSPWKQLTREDLKKAGKKAFAFYADRMRVGTYSGIDPTSGINIPLQGGFNYPAQQEMIDNFIAWAVSDEKTVKSMITSAKRTGGYAIIALFSRGNVTGNATFLRAYFEELRWNIKQGKITEQQALDFFHEAKQSAGVKNNAIPSAKGTIDKATGEKVPPTAERLKEVEDKREAFAKNRWTSLDEVERVLGSLSFKLRGSGFFKTTLNENAKRGVHIAAGIMGKQELVNAGMPDVAKMVELMEEPSFTNLPLGTIVGIVRVDPDQKVQTAVQMGVTPHVSYPYVVRGERVGVFKKEHHIEDFIPLKPKSSRIMEGEAMAATISFSISPIRNLNELSDQVERNFAENPVGALEVKSRMIRQFAKYADKWSQERWTPQGNKVRPISEKRTVKSLDKEQAMRQATLEGEKIAANMEASQARQQAKAEAQAWRDETDAMQKEDWSPRESLVRDLITLEAIRAMFPQEIRDKIGGFVALARKASEAARLKVLQKQLERGQVLLEKHLKDQYGMAVDKLFDKYRPERKAGEKPKGKLDPDAQEIADKSESVMDLNADQVNAEIAAINVLLDADNISAEDEAKLEAMRELVQLLGDWKNADSARRESAFIALNDVLSEGWAKWKLKQLLKREQREEMRKELKSATGKKGVGIERDKMKKEAAKVLGKAARWVLNLSSFSEVMRAVFGENASRQFIDNERNASNQYEDAIQEFSERIDEFFTTLAGGVLRGERLCFDLAQPTLTIGAGGMNERNISQLQGIQALLMWQQEDGRRHMEGPRDENGAPIEGKWSYDQAWIDELTSKLSLEAVEVKKFIEQLYSEEWVPLNAVYRERHGVNLPRHDKYAPITVTPQQAKAGEMVDPVSGAAIAGSILTPGSLRSRNRSALAEPEFRDALSTFIAHTKQMEHWKAYYDLAVEMQSVLGNRDVSNSVKAAVGDEGVTVLRKWIDVFAQGGTRDAAAGLAISGGLGKLAGRVATVGLLGRFSTLLVQSTQLAAASVKMPTGSYLKRLALLMSGNLQWSDAINSEFIQRRIKSAPPLISQAMQSLGEATRPNEIKRVTRYLGQLLSGADGLFTAGTYAILLDYHRTMGAKMGMQGEALESYAHAEAVNATEQVAQPVRTGTRSIIEVTNTNPLAKMSWAYASEARQKMALFAWSAYNAKNDPAGTAKTAFLVFVVGGLMSQLLKNLWREAKGDDDEKKWSPERLAMSLLSPITSAIPGASMLAGEGGSLSGAQYTQQSIKDVFDGKADMKDVDTILSAMGYFNDTAGGIATLSHAGYDFAKLLENAFGED